MWWQHYVWKNVSLWKRTEWYYFERLKKALTYIKNNLTDSHNKFLTVNSLIGNIITESNSIILTTVDVRPCGYNKMYIDKDLKYKDKDHI